jgi:hypothetical protein
MVSISKAYPDLSPFVNTITLNVPSEFPYGPQFEYESLDNNSPEFIGIYANECEVQIPFGKQNIKARGVDFLISNQEIKGWLEVKPTNSFSKDDVAKRLAELHFTNVKVKESAELWVFKFDYLR